MKFFSDVSLSSVFAGGVTVLVGITSSLALVFQAAVAAGASPVQMGSWVWALGLGMGVTCVGLSLRFRMPIVTAWSTSGAAMLIISAPGLPMAEVIAAFVMSSVLVALVGFSGVFERFMDRVPLSLAAGMLAGVLLRLGVDVFVVMSSQLWLPLIMVLVYLFSMRWWPRYAVVLTMLVGMAWAAWQGQLHLQDIQWQWAHPVWITPSFTLSGFISLALPFFIVNMASQNIPGVASLRAHDYHPPLSPVIGWIGVANVLLAPFGAFSVNLAAITASICSSPEAHPDRTKRYTAAGTYNAKTPPTDTFNTDIRDRVRWCGYLMTVGAPGLISH
jgi:benzoate membrane transport protein